MAHISEGPRQREIIDFYDKAVFDPLFTDYFGFGQFMNFGYWEDGIDRPAQAGENLVRKLLSHRPASGHRILDVACGKGASTALLKGFYPAGGITGINISPRQVEKCRENAPGCEFLRMDAAHLGFGDESFDCVLCVEAAFHFKTRERFLREAHRVLRPGGRLLLSDVLMTREGERKRGRHIEANYVSDPEEYASRLRRAGFQRVEVTDATKPCWHAYYWHWVHFLHAAYLKGEIGLDELRKYLAGNYERVGILKYYLLAWAEK